MNAFDAITLYGAVCIGLVIAIYDVYVWQQYGIEATITRRIKRASKFYPAIPLLMAFGMGLLVGHFFL